MSTTQPTSQEAMRLDILIEACMDLLGMNRAEAEAKVREAAALLDWPLTEVGHA